MPQVVPCSWLALRMKRLAFVLFFVFTSAAYAWNGTGHKAIALMAYERLTAAARQRVDQVLAKHPDYPNWIAEVPAADRGRAAFLAAATWPDAIRRDPRFHNDHRRPTPPIPGLPPGAQARHADWHFINMPFSPDGTRTIPAPAPNIVTKLEECKTIGRMSAEQQVYTLPWLLHLVGDIHQPLHVLQRFTLDFPRGDRGGNAVRLRGTSNLHSYWDSHL